MSRLIASINITLDGYLSGPRCELDWHFRSWSADMADELTRQLGTVDAIFLGRITYCAMASYWSAVSSDKSYPRPDLPFATLINAKKKYVFSNSVVRSMWQNSEVVSGELSHAVQHLKCSINGDAVIYGSAMLVQSLIGLRLLDRVVLWIHPVVLGAGKRLFRGPADAEHLTLASIKQFSSGVTAITYDFPPFKADKF